MTLQETLKTTKETLDAAGVPDAESDAEILLAHVLGTRRVDLHFRRHQNISPEATRRLRALVERRCADREPVAYLTGVAGFWTFDLTVDPRVLIPRPETEGLVTVGIELVANTPHPTIVDVGTGSGAVAIAIALEIPDAEIWALDISHDAIQVAASNAASVAPGAEISFAVSDLFGDLDLPTFDLIISNPPYVESMWRQTAQPELAHEPETALYAGVDGLDLIRKLIIRSRARLKPSGAIAIEHGYEQASLIRDLLHQAGYSAVQTVQDLAGHDRVTHARLDSFEPK